MGTQDTSEFYHGTEETSATSTGWNDQDSVHHDDVTVIWDADNYATYILSGSLTITGTLNVTY